MLTSQLLRFSDTLRSLLGWSCSRFLEEMHQGWGSYLLLLHYHDIPFPVLTLATDREYSSYHMVRRTPSLSRLP